MAAHESPRTRACCLALLFILMLGTTANGTEAFCNGLRPPDRQQCEKVLQACDWNKLRQLVTFNLHHAGQQKVCFWLPGTPMGPMIGNFRLIAPDHAIFQTAGGLPTIPERWISVQLQKTKTRGNPIQAYNTAVTKLSRSILVPNGSTTYTTDDGLVIQVPEFKALPLPMKLLTRPLPNQ
jgi:hypothetical protein